MAFEIGIDTYMSLDEADKIVREHYLSISKEVKLWDSLTDKDKEVLLRRTTHNIDSLMWIGIKDTNSDSKLGFPRIIDGKKVDTPYEVKLAVIEQLFRDNMVGDSELDKIKQLKDVGVTRYSISDASISIKADGDVFGNTGIDRRIYEKYLINYVY